MKTGIPSSPGIGAGTVYVLHEREIPLGRTGPASGSDGVKPHTVRSDESEMERFSRGCRVAETHYNHLIERVRQNYR